MAYLGRRVFFVGMAAATASAGCAVPAAIIDGKAPGRYVETLQVNGVPRETILRIPKTEGPRPLVIVLHGWTASGAMAERSQNLQDLFLNTVRKQKISLTIFLINGVKLTGVVTSFDNFCVLLRRDGHSQLVYKHAISTIMPGQPVHLMETETTEA